jgi:hypothetical protein
LEQAYHISNKALQRVMRSLLSGCGCTKPIASRHTTGEYEALGHMQSKSTPNTVRHNGISIATETCFRAAAEFGGDSACP